MEHYCRLECWFHHQTRRSTLDPQQLRVPLSLRSRFETSPIAYSFLGLTSLTQNAGISVLPSILNAALLSSAWSAGCADLFVSSRTLYGLYTRGHAFKLLGKTRKDGLPWVCVLVGAAFSLLSFMAASQHGKAGTVFGYCKF